MKLYLIRQVKSVPNRAVTKSDPINRLKKTSRKIPRRSCPWFVGFSHVLEVHEPSGSENAIDLPPKKKCYSTGLVVAFISHDLWAHLSFSVQNMDPLVRWSWD